MSRMAEIENPTACSARNALSRPEPGPLTSISNISMPCSRAFLPASSAATCAAYGVDLRLPLKPWLPADDQAMALPCASVMVITVLLNVAATWATPDVIFLRSFLRGRAPAAGLAIFLGPVPTGAALIGQRRICDAATAANGLLGDLLLAGDRDCLPLARARIGVGALAAHRQPAAMTQPAIAAQVHQPLDVHRDLAPQVAF